MEKVRGTNRRCFSDRYYDVVILGAIEIYKRTGSHTILQQAMGHASLAVTLGYLRGLEIPSLKLEDMPRL